MKIRVVAWLLVALWPVCARGQEQTAPSSPAIVASIDMEPAAEALLERAMESYKGASGVSYTAVNARNGKDVGTTTFRYSRPNMLSFSLSRDNYSSKTLIDGSNVYLISKGTEYHKYPAPPEAASAFIATREGASQMIAAMMDGENPLNAAHNFYSSEPFKNFKLSRVVALSPRVVDGSVLSGVQYTYSFSVSFKDDKVESFSNQMTAWFGGAPLMLRRVQSRLVDRGKVTTMTEKITEQQVSPTFAEDTFKFDDTGLKLIADEVRPYFDPRLKVGAVPLPFRAKALNGAAISLEKYKGKVLVLDFWATWCGPCVASLPELKAAYDKYHSQGLEVVGISLDQDRNALTAFIKAKKMAWPQTFDNDNEKASVADAYGVKAIPFLLVIGKDGKIAAVNPRGKIGEAVKAALDAK